MFERETFCIDLYSLKYERDHLRSKLLSLLFCKPVRKKKGSPASYPFALIHSGSVNIKVGLSHMQ